MFSKMVKKVLTTAIVLCMIAGSTVLCNVSAADGSENLYKGGTVTQNNTTAEMIPISVPRLTDNFTFEGKVKILEMGQQPWNGIRFVIGYNGAQDDQIVVTKAMGTRVSFAGKDKDASGVDIVGNSPSYDAGSEFTFSIKREGLAVTFSFNGEEALKTAIEAADDAFVYGNNKNLGFIGSECKFEVSDIVVKCPEAASEYVSNLYEGGNVANGVQAETWNLLATVGLADSFTYKGHVKMVSLGAQGWNGLRLVVGYNHETRKYDEIIIMPNIKRVGYDFMGDNLNGVQYPIENLKNVNEFDFEIVKDGHTVALLLDGDFVCSAVIPEANDAFTHGSGAQLGFHSSDCSFEATDIVVYNNGMTGPEGSGQTQSGENLYKGSKVVCEAADNNDLYLLTVPGLEDTFTLSGHAKINKIGDKDYNGLRIVVGANAETGEKDAVLITKNWGVRVDFKGDNLSDLFRSTGFNLADGTEFDFTVIRTGRRVILSINNNVILEVDIPEADDVFTEGNDQNIGFQASECGFEISNIKVTGKTAASGGEEENPGGGESGTPGSGESGNPGGGQEGGQGGSQGGSSGQTPNPESGDATVMAAFAVAAIVFAAVMVKKRSVHA